MCGRLYALSSSFLLFLNIIYESTSTAVEQTKNAVKRSLLDDKQAVSPLPDEERYKSLKQEAPVLGEAGSNPPAYAGARPTAPQSQFLNSCCTLSRKPVVVDPKLTAIFSLQRFKEMKLD